MTNKEAMGEKFDYGNIPCGVVTFNIDDMKILYANDVYENIFNCGNSEYLNVYEEDTEKLRNKILSDTDGGAVSSAEYRFINKNKKTANAYMTFSVRDDRTVVAAVFEDSKTGGVYRIYKEALTNEKIMVMEVEFQNDICRIVCPGEKKELTIENFSENALKCGFEKAEDVEFILSKKKSDETRTLRFRNRNGAKWKWYMLYRSIICDENGKPVRVSGALCNIDKQKKAEETLISKIEMDPLTKVYSRESGKEKIVDYLSGRSKKCDYALFVLDLDNFKLINDTFGHLYGDAVLTMAAGCIKSSVGEDDIVGRFGGDEFFVLVKDSDYEDIMRKAEKINKSILSMRTNISDDNDISCSIGVAYGTDESDTYEELFKMADIALYKAKNSGKNSITVYTGDMSDDAGGGVCYEQDDNENKTQAHDLTHVAIEIAARSTSFQNAVHMIMRHIGLALDVDDIKIMRVNYDDDMVSIEHHWSKVENVAERDNRTGYYIHEDVINLRKKFEKDPLFVVGEETKEGFSEKFARELDKLNNKSVVYSSSLTRDESFFMLILSCFRAEREWTEENKKTIADITKILFVYLTKNYKEKASPEEDPLITEPHTKMLYYDKFFEQSELVRKLAFENGQKVSVMHIDFHHMHMFNRIYGRRVGEAIIIEYAAKLKKEMDEYKNRCIATHIYGTDSFIILIRHNGDIHKISEELRAFNEEFRAEKKLKFSKYEFIMKVGVANVEKGEPLSLIIDDAHLIKKNHPEPTECVCYMVGE